jgi:hypothetical protein
MASRRNPGFPAAFGFSKDGSLLSVIRRSLSRAWELVAIEVHTFVTPGVR